MLEKRNPGSPLAGRIWLHFPLSHCHHPAQRLWCPLPSQGCPGTAVLEVPIHPSTSLPSDSICLPWLPPPAWDLTEEISGSCQHSFYAAPCHFQFPKVLFFRESISLHTTHSPSPLFIPTLFYPSHPPWLYEWQFSQVSCQIFFGTFLELSQWELALLGVSVLPCCTGQSQQNCKPAAAEERGTQSLKSVFR